MTAREWGKMIGVLFDALDEDGANDELLGMVDALHEAGLRHIKERDEVERHALLMDNAAYVKEAM